MANKNQSSMTPEQQAELDAMLAEIEGLQKDLSKPVVKSPEQIINEKKAELLALKEEQRVAAQKAKDDAAYHKAVVEHGVTRLAVLDGRQGMIILRAPKESERMEFESRLEKSNENDREKVIREHCREILVHPTLNEFDSMMKEYEIRWVDLGGKYAEMQRGEAQFRQKKG